MFCVITASPHKSLFISFDKQFSGATLRIFAFDLAVCVHKLLESLICLSIYKLKIIFLCKLLIRLKAPCI